MADRDAIAVVDWVQWGVTVSFVGERVLVGRVADGALRLSDAAGGWVSDMLWSAADHLRTWSAGGDPFHLGQAIGSLRALEAAEWADRRRLAMWCQDAASFLSILAADPARQGWTTVRDPDTWSKMLLEQAERVAKVLDDG